MDPPLAKRWWYLQMISTCQPRRSMVPSPLSKSCGSGLIMGTGLTGNNGSLTVFTDWNDFFQYTGYFHYPSSSSASQLSSSSSLIILVVIMIVSVTTVMVVIFVVINVFVIIVTITCLIFISFSYSFTLFDAVVVLFCLQKGHISFGAC